MEESWLKLVTYANTYLLGFDLDHYLLGPDGIYLDEISDVSFDSIAWLDPEPTLGPVDPR